MSRYKISAIENVPKIEAEYYVSISDKDTESFTILNQIFPDFDKSGLIVFSKDDFPVNELEVVCEDEIPTENNQEGFSLNSCSNPDEIFDGIMDNYEPLGEVTDVVAGEDKKLPDLFKTKFLELYNSGELEGFEFEQNDNSVTVEGKMKVEKI